MIKDILIKKVQDVVLAVLPQIQDPESTIWEVYLINLQQDALVNVLVSSRGFRIEDGQETKTSVLRHYFEEIGPVSYQMIEHIQAEVFSLHNEYWVTFNQKEPDDYLFDKKFTFVAESIHEDNFTDIPLIGRKGVMIG
ncbi:MAG: hypothetical protein AAFU33_14370 [Bacteroidota bacterium]